MAVLSELWGASVVLRSMLRVRFLATGGNSLMRLAGVMTGLVSEVDRTRSPTVRDADGWLDLVEEYGWMDEDVTFHLSKHVVDGSYPRKEYDKLLGIGRDIQEVDGFYLSNFHYDLDRVEFLGFWSNLSQVTEPFVVYHSGLDGHWPHVSAYKLSEYEHGDSIGSVYKLVCEEGIVNVSETSFKANAWSTIDRQEVNP